MTEDWSRSRVHGYCSYSGRFGTHVDPDGYLEEYFGILA
jgi:hypothetical protein